MDDYEPRADGRTSINIIEMRLTLQPPGPHRARRAVDDQDLTQLDLDIVGVDVDLFEDDDPEHATSSPDYRSAELTDRRVEAFAHLVPIHDLERDKNMGRAGRDWAVYDTRLLAVTAIDAVVAGTGLHAAAGTPEATFWRRSNDKLSCPRPSVPTLNTARLRSGRSTGCSICMRPPDQRPRGPPRRRARRSQSSPSSSPNPSMHTALRHHANRRHDAARARPVQSR